LLFSFRFVEKSYEIAYDYSVVILKKIRLLLANLGYRETQNVVTFSGKKRLIVFILRVNAILFFPIALTSLFYHKIRRNISRESEPRNSNRIRFDNNGKVFVVLAPIDWNFRHQRPQNIAQCIVKHGDHVIYLNPTIEYAQGNHDEISAFQVDGVWVCTIKSKFRQRSFYIGTMGFPDELAEGVAKLVETFIANKFNSSALIIVQQPAWWPLVERLQGNQLLFDCMDLHSGFMEIDPETIVNEKNLDIASDSIVVSSKFLLDTKSADWGLSKRIDVIRNGVNFSLFGSNSISDQAGVVGYFGALAEWFDIDLVKFLIEANPSIRFEFIGRVSFSEIKTQLDQYSNVRFLGEVANSELPQFVTAWSAGLIPFKLSSLILATNPVKMYEYASMGIPTVATRIPEVEMAAKETAGIYVSCSNHEFDQNLQLALSLSNSDRQNLRIWSKSQDWSQRAQELVNFSNAIPKISIVVLMWNQGLMTLRCLQSILQRSDYPNMEIILVDNDSKIEESKIVTNWLEKESLAHIRYIRTSTNLGFAGGNNVGLREATGDYLVILNNDTEVSPGWIWRSLRHFYRNPNLGVLGPSTNNSGNESRVKLRGIEIDWLSEVIPRFNFRVSKLLKVNTVAFFCVFIPRGTFEKVGTISEEYGRGYFEDDDYCRRVQSMGYEIGIARDIFVYHKMGASFNLLKDSEKSELFHENKQKYEAKWGNWTPHSYAFDTDQA
jgi:O-antigen biosynthesis protein